MGRKASKGGGGGGGGGCSSIDSNSNSNYHPSLSSVSSSSPSSLICDNKNQLPKTSKDLSTDLRLGLNISPPSPNSQFHQNQDYFSSSSSSPVHPRKQRLSWPPIKPLLRSRVASENANTQFYAAAALFVKVYMEGIPIGRKLDLFAHQDYHSLITALSHMFNTAILCPDADGVHSAKYHVLTYEDKEGDWMMVGDVPWEMFLTTVKRLKITRGDRC
ncbi:auxin-responsive protein IAA31 [Cornus florida]|uniref:auxin-responsive protein IAA31 n=1 Tax=Cornus florida TaxID=4283 RepID=UPI00289CF8E7|nr:auxin-responsive protein IAA31 [Cornus florida]